MTLVEWIMNLKNRFSDTTGENPIDSDLDEASVCFDNSTEDSTGKESVVEESRYGSAKTEHGEDGLIEGDSCSCAATELTGESTQSTLGWPLLRLKASSFADSYEESEFSDHSETTGAISHSNRSTKDFPQSEIRLSFKEKNLVQQDFCYWEAPERPKEAKLMRKVRSFGYKQFSYQELEKATHNFSSENLIGKGGCSTVYKGSLRWGKPVAVKVLKQYKKAWNDFYLEVDIISSLKHKHITPLIGVCMENSHLILVYNFLPNGNLEDSLQGQIEKSILPWKTRFKVAIAVAEALNYLHDKYGRPVIHRDVKSSNILLSNDYRPQLSDFGLAIWGPEDSAYITSSDVVGTIGYIAPEYFMHGRVSEKIDIYSLGILLLELLTGKKPISSQGSKGQKSLIKWAMPLIKSGNVEALIDPKLSGEFEIGQVHRMVLAATLCIKQSPRLRPKAGQILTLLEGKEISEWTNVYVNGLKESTDEEVDNVLPSSMVLEDDSASLSHAGRSLSRIVRKHRPKLKEFLMERQY